MIKELLRTIPDHLRKQLMCAFEQGIEQIVHLDDEQFLGVNVVNPTGYIVEEEAGKFSYGKVKR